MPLHFTSFSVILSPCANIRGRTHIIYEPINLHCTKKSHLNGFLFIITFVKNFIKMRIHFNMRLLGWCHERWRGLGSKSHHRLKYWTYLWRKYLFMESWCRFPIISFLRELNLFFKFLRLQFLKVYQSEI